MDTGCSAWVGVYLKEIAGWCAAEGWTGRLYSAAPGCDLEHWEAEAAACTLFRGYPETVP